MPWDCEQTMQGSIKTILPCSFTSSVIAIDISADNQQPTWYQSGFLRAILEVDGEPFTGANIQTQFGQQVINFAFSIYTLEFSPRVWLASTTIKIKQLSIAQIGALNMGINLAPNQAEVLGDENITIVNASITNVVLDAANPSRRDGFIINKSNRNLWVRFGATAATAAAPTSFVPPASNITIPEGYTGVINGIWSGPTPTNNAEVHQFNAI
jgi:hypothetical protein